MNFSLNGLSINVFGKKSDNAIIFIHGFPYDHRMWGNQIKEFRKSYYVIAYDIRGLGKSRVGDGQYTMELFADDLLMITDELNLAKPVLCGLSMGGYIALRAAERNQHAFRGLILCDTRSASDDNKGKLKRADAIAGINREGGEKFVESFVPLCFAEETVTNMPKYYSRILGRARRTNARALKGCLLAMAGRTDTTHFLANLEIPALLICGVLDKLTPAVMMREISEMIAGSEFAAVPRAGHMSPLENPGFVNDVIRGFLEKHPVKTALRS